jgi:hypothetical protein
MPPGDDPAAAGAKEPSEDGADKKPSKKMKIDPAILQRALQLRNQSR